MTWQIPFRLRVLRAITTTLQGITPANGYQFDLSSNGAVVRGRTALGDDEPEVMVSLLEPPAAVDQKRTSADKVSRETDWDLLIQGWAKDPMASAEFQPCDMAYMLAADVQKALALARPKQPGRPSIFGFDRVTNMTVTPAVVRPAENTATDFGMFYIILTLRIVEDMTAPFG